MCGGNRRKPPTLKNFITMLYRVHPAIRTYLSQSATYWKTNTAKTLKWLVFSFVLEKNNVGNGRRLPGVHGLSFIVTKGLPIPHYTEEKELKLFSTEIDNLILMEKLT